jgi:acyl-coenzyme A thioesterase PaaI-like protein
MRRLGNLWLPFWGAGISIAYVSPDYREIHVQMKLRWYNRNYVGTHFGGSLYAMTDPFYMMMLINNLGREYIVWDKGAHIEFVKPGRSTVRAHFVLTADQIQKIKNTVDQEGKYVFELPVEVLSESEQIVASVQKTLYVRRKRQFATSVDGVDGSIAL